MVKNSRKDRGIDLWHQLRKEKRKRKRSNPADATSSNMTSGLESHANKQRHEVSVPKRRYSNQCQRGGTRISAKEEVLEQVKRQTRPVFHDIWDHDYGDLIMDVKRDKRHLKRWNTMSTDNDDHLHDQRRGALDYQGCRTRQIIRYVELEDRY